jgi:hypothetical protein
MPLLVRSSPGAGGVWLGETVVVWGERSPVLAGAVAEEL